MKDFFDNTLGETAAKGMNIGRIVAPWIMANHIDGPLLHFSDCQVHWLTIWERIQFRLGWTNARELQRKLRPRLSAEVEPLLGRLCEPT